MGVEVFGGGGGALAARIAQLTRFGYSRASINAALTNDLTYFFGGALPALGPAVATGGGGIAPVRAQADGRRVWQLVPTLANGSDMEWRGLTAAGAATEQLASMRETPPNFLEAVAEAGNAYAYVTQAWLRKNNNVNPCWSRQRFGIAYAGVGYQVNAEGFSSHVGVIGDGANGFRCGSINCPDGTAVANNSAGAADPGFIQPAALLNPGLSWFHVKVKLVPATPNAPPAVGIYLDGKLIVSYFTNAHFPRGSSAVNRDYLNVCASAFCGFDAVTQLNGWWVHDWEVWYDTDLSL